VEKAVGVANADPIMSAHTRAICDVAIRALGLPAGLALDGFADHCAGEERCW
jgi:hypothetical protein